MRGKRVTHICCYLMADFCMGSGHGGRDGGEGLAVVEFAHGVMETLVSSDGGSSVDASIGSNPDDDATKDARHVKGVADPHPAGVPRPQ